MNAAPPNAESWPPIPWPDWQPTATALHLYLQIVGKYRLARSPWVNHSWHATLYVTPRGLTTSLIPDGPGGIEVRFDLLDHVLRAQCGSGEGGGFALQAMTVAEFHEQFLALIQRLGGDPVFHGRPNEVADPVPFAADRTARPWDRDAVTRFHRALVSVNRVLQQFRTGFRGKVSPVHLFWGSFDIAVTRFSGRRAPLHPGGVPGLPDAVTREAYSHEVASAGFWPGGGPVDEAAFYAYAYPQPAGYADAVIEPPAATYDANYGEFILPYEAVRKSSAPDTALLAFLDSTYGAAARLGHWDPELECPRGLLGSPPPVS